jgi:tRNA dimethylallyltransferase
VQRLDAAVEQIVVRTRQFAVRQLRWFRRDPRVRWVDVVHDPVAEAGPIVAAALDA